MRKILHLAHQAARIRSPLLIAGTTKIHRMKVARPSSEHNAKLAGRKRELMRAQNPDKAPLLAAAGVPWKARLAGNRKLSCPVDLLCISPLRPSMFKSD